MTTPDFNGLEPGHNFLSELYGEKRKWLVCDYCVVDINEIIGIHIRTDHDVYCICIRTANSIMIADKKLNITDAIASMKKIFDKIKQEGDEIIDVQWKPEDEK